MANVLILTLCIILTKINDFYKKQVMCIGV